jgi:hypothetical protein
MKILKNIAVVLLLNVLFLALPYSKINAQSARSFSISPPNFEINANPGDVVKNTIKVQNISDVDMIFDMKAENFVAYGDEGQVSLTEEDSTYSISKWLEFSSVQFAVPAHGEYLFDFTINIPQNAEPGSHYGAVVFSNGASGIIESGSGANVVQEIGALVLIRIPGEVNEDASIVNFAPVSEYFTDPKIKFTSIVENTGGVHFKMTPLIKIYDIFGNKVKTIDVASHNVLPETKRIFDAESDFDGFGYYRAEIEMFYAGGAKILHADSHFIALNTAKSIPITLGVVTAIAVYIIFHKRINKAIKIIVKG